MRPEERPFMRWSDLCLLGLVLVLSLVYYFWPREQHPGERLAQIDHEGRLVMAIPLHEGQEERIFSPPGLEQVQFKLYKDGSIAFYKAQCPDQICVRQGRLGQLGDFAACVPNRLGLQILSAETEETQELAPDLIIG